ncbi:MAG TPA: LanC-like protein [Burkholderiaceae bacterium]|nr:LanC-like protein [Burkholderiaceae bacterium]
MLHDPARHEALNGTAWDEALVRAAIAQIVADTEARCMPGTCWPPHPLDLEPGDDPAQPFTPLYFGAAGVIWALHYLQAVGAARLTRSYLDDLERLRLRNRAWLEADDSTDFASYLMGDTPILMQAHGAEPTPASADALASLIAGNAEHPTRELMWGAPGTLLAALFMHERTGDARWADLFRSTAATLWSQLEWSPKHECHYWTQDLYGQRSNYIDAVHGFVATALPLIRGRALLDEADWAAWQQCIVNTVQRTASREDGMANWRPWLEVWEGSKAPMLMQYCQGAPGFVVCLGGMPGSALDPLLLAAGEAIWAAGPLTKGSNLCHGTGGNGYAFLKLYRRSGDARWLERARAFAMHGLAQTQADAARYGQGRYSLWTGDPGFAIYLWDCLRGEAAFPTLEVFWA